MNYAMSVISMSKSNDNSEQAVSPINRYMHEISHYRLLTIEETNLLTKQVFEDGDSKAGRKLIVSNLRLVVKVVMGFQKYWMNNFLDLVQEGNFGLTKAVDKYDPSRGVKFSSYAAYWIRAYILKFIMDNWRLVKIGTTQAQRKLFYSLNKEKKLLESQGITPKADVLSKRLDVKESEIVEMSQRLNNFDLSLEAPIRAGSDVEQKTFLKCHAPSVEEKVVERDFVEWFRKKLDKFKDTLSEREQVILSDRMLNDEPRTLNDIAGQFSISRERIRQLEMVLLAKLKKLLEKEVVCH